MVVVEGRARAVRRRTAHVNELEGAGFAAIKSIGRAHARCRRAHVQIARQNDQLNAELAA